MHPKKDPWGKPLTKGLLAELAGQPLTKGHHIQGDAEFYANVLKPPHWQNQYPCHECDAQRPVYKKVPCPEGKSVKLLRAEDQAYVDVTPEMAGLAKRSSHPLFNIPRVTTAMVRGDSLHILYSRGVASHLAGSLLHYMCFYDYPKRQSVPASQRLEKIFTKIKDLYSANKVAARLTNLRLSMLCDTQKPHKNFACLEAKAAETKHFFTLLGESGWRSSGPWGKPNSQHHAGVHPLLEPAHPAHR